MLKALDVCFAAIIIVELNRKALFWITKTQNGFIHGTAPHTSNADSLEITCQKTYYILLIGINWAETMLRWYSNQPQHRIFFVWFWMLQENNRTEKYRTRLVVARNKRYDKWRLVEAWQDSRILAFCVINWHTAVEKFRLAVYNCS